MFLSQTWCDYDVTHIHPVKKQNHLVFYRSNVEINYFNIQSGILGPLIILLHNKLLANRLFNFGTELIFNCIIKTIHRISQYDFLLKVIYDNEGL